MSFVLDLQAGVEVEEQFVKFLKEFGWKAGRNTSTTLTEKRFYDIWATRPNTSAVSTYEIKFDRRASTTGNVYLEHETLENSRADFIVYKLDGENIFYMQDRPTVLNLLFHPAYKQVSGGDKWGLGTLIPVEEFKKLFHRFEDKPKKKASKKTR